MKLSFGLICVNPCLTLVEFLRGSIWSDLDLLIAADSSITLSIYSITHGCQNVKSKPENFSLGSVEFSSFF
jgi:hypothetical protein